MGRHLLLAQRPNSVLGVWQAEFLLTAPGGSVCLVQLQQLLAILGTALLEAGSPECLLHPLWPSFLRLFSLIRALSSWTHPTLRGLILRDYICKNPVPKLGHILSCRG